VAETTQVDWAGRRALVTGATGFVGAHLAAELLRREAIVTSLERPGAGPGVLAALGIANQVHMVEGDITKAEDVAAAFTAAMPAAVFHLAAQSIVGKGEAAREQTIDVNVGGTWHVLNTAVGHQDTLRAIVLASSAAVYDTDKPPPYAESDRLTQSPHAYAQSKVAAEATADHFMVEYRLPVASLRKGNVYGPADPNLSRLIPDAVRVACDGGTLQIRSDGQFKAGYLYVDDAVAGYLAAAEALERDPHAISGEAFNLGPGTPGTVLDVVDRVFAIADNPAARYEVLAEVITAGKGRWLDPSKAARVLGWRAETSLDDGLRKTLEHARRSRSTA